MSQSFHRPSDLELQILGVLWEHGSSTARDVLNAMPDGKDRAYTSILSVMQVMRRKGLLELAPHRKKLAHVYAPAVTRSAVVGPVMRNLLQRVFAGRPAQAVQQLLDEAEISADELSEIRGFLDAVEDRTKEDRHA